MTFARPTYKRERVYPKPIPEHLRSTAVMGRADGYVITVGKEGAIHHEGYRRLVAAMPCAHCGIHGHSQAAHADQGKGLNIKSDDRTCYPACAPRVGHIGCHALIGMTGSMPRESRRSLEQEYAARTRAEIENEGLWPALLPKWGINGNS